MKKKKNIPLSALPEGGYVRLWQIIGNPESDPPIPPIFPVSKSTWWAGVKSGRFPKSVNLSERITAWKIEDIRELIANPEARLERQHDEPDH